MEKLKIQSKQPLAKLMGELEAQIMDHIWSLETGHQNVSVRQVCDNMHTNKKLAYNTIMTVMNNLATKNILSTTKQDGINIYAPVLTREQFINTKVANLLDSILEDFSVPAFDYLQHKHLLDKLKK